MNAVDGARQLTKSRPDAVLLDLHMQEVSEGLAFLRRLRSIDAYQTTPVAIITGDYAVDSAVESDLRGYGATIRFKPFWLDDLVALVRDLTTDLPRQSQNIARRSPFARQVRATTIDAPAPSTFKAYGRAEWTRRNEAFLACAMLDIDRVVPLNEANVDEYLFHRTQFVNQGRECDEMLD